MSFFTTSLRRDREAQLKKTAISKSGIGSKAGEWRYFPATRTCNRVAALRHYERFPKMVMSASETTEILLRQRVQTVAHAVELLNFSQNRNRKHRAPDFRENLIRRKDFRGADLAQRTLRE